MKKKFLSMVVSIFMISMMAPVIVFAKDTLVVSDSSGTPIMAVGNIIKISEKGSYIATGASTTTRIEITANEGKVDLVLNGVNINVSKIANAAAIKISGNCDVIINLVGDNELISGIGCDTGLQKSNSRQKALTITSEKIEGGYKGTLSMSYCHIVIW